MATDAVDTQDYMLDAYKEREEHEELLEYRDMLHMTKRFKRIHVEKFRTKFQMFEAPRGYVPIENIGGLMRTCGLKVSDQEGLRIAEDSELPDPDKVEFSEFLVMMGKHMPEFDADIDSEMSLSLIGQVGRNELKEAFQVFDKEDNGRISTRMLRLVVSYLGEPLSDDEVYCMLKEADPNGTGMVDIEQFVEFLCGPNPPPDTPDAISEKEAEDEDDADYSVSTESQVQ